MFLLMWTAQVCNQHIEYDDNLFFVKIEIDFTTNINLPFQYIQNRMRNWTSIFQHLEYFYGMVMLSILCHIWIIRENVFLLEIITTTIPESHFPSTPSCIEMQLCWKYRQQFNIKWFFGTVHQEAHRKGKYSEYGRVSLQWYG